MNCQYDSGWIDPFWSVPKRQPIRRSGQLERRDAGRHFSAILVDFRPISLVTTANRAAGRMAWPLLNLIRPRWRLAPTAENIKHFKTST